MPKQYPLKLDYRKETITVSRKVITFEEARRIIRESYPHAVKKHTTKSKFSGGKIKVYVDWRTLFLNPMVQMHLLNHIIHERD